MKIRPGVAKLFDADKQTNRLLNSHDEAKSRFSKFSEHICKAVTFKTTPFPDTHVVCECTHRHDVNQHHGHSLCY